MALQEVHRLAGESSREPYSEFFGLRAETHCLCYRRASYVLTKVERSSRLYPEIGFICCVPYGFQRQVLRTKSSWSPSPA